MGPAALRILVLLAAAGSRPGATSSTEEVAADLGLSETVVVEGRLLDAPGAGGSAAAPAALVLGAEDVARDGALSVPELLARQPLVAAVDQVGNGRQLSLSLRGFAGSEGATTLLVDGVRMNDADTNVAPWELLRAEELDSIELAPGPLGALLGGGSLGGTIRVTRRRPAAEPEGEARARAGRFGHRDLSAVASGPAGDWRWLASGSAFRDDGFRNDAGSQETAGRVALEREALHGTLALGWSRVEGRWRQPGALKASELRDDPADSHFNALDAQATAHDLATVRWDGGSEPHRVGGVLAVRRRELDLLTTGRSCFGFRTRDDQRSQSLAVEGALDARPGRLAVRWGAEASRDRLHPDGFATDATCDGEIHDEALSSSVDLDWDRAAIFTGLGWRTRRGLDLEASVRHDRARVERRGMEVSGAGRPEAVSGTRSFADTTARAGVGARGTTRAKAAWEWRAAWEQSFLAPSAIQLFAYPGFFSNPDLKPQRGAGPALSAAWTTDRWHAGLELFEIRVRDEIAYDDALRRNVNAGSTRRRGATVRAAWQPHARVRAEASIGLVDATFRGGFEQGTRVRKGARVPLVPRRRAVLALDLGPWRGFRARLDLQRLDGAPLSNDFDNSSPGLRARTVASAALRQELPGGLALELAAENLLDDRRPSRGIEAWDDLYYTPPAPRRLTLGLSWQLR